MADKIIFHVEDLRKSYGLVEVLSGITLSFLEGAKIGMIGPNGAGKSTLLRILAGEDQQFEGTAKPAKGLSIGYLSQEPPLNEELNVWDNLMEAVGPLQATLDRYNEVTELMGTAMDLPGRDKWWRKHVVNPKKLLSSKGLD